MKDKQTEHRQPAECCAHCGLPQSELPGGMLHKNGVLLCVDDLGCKERAEETSEGTPQPIHKYGIVTFHPTNLEHGLKDAIEYLQKLYDKYKDSYDDLRLDFSSDGGSWGEPEFSLDGTRLETKEEVDARLVAKKNLEENKLRKERELYEELKRKFEE
jgi:hypothetical protein